MMLTVGPDPTGGARLILAGDALRSDDDEDDTEEWRTFLDLAIEPAALARAFGTKFQAYLQTGFSPEAWGADLRYLVLGAG